MSEDVQRTNREIAAELQRKGWGHPDRSIPEICAALLTTTSENESLQAEVERLRDWAKIEGDLLLELTDQEPCSYDHHDYCQTHGLSERPCIQERARAWLGCPLPTDQPGLPKATTDKNSTRKLGGSE